MRPDKLIDEICERARKNHRRVALPEATDANMLMAARIAFDEGYCIPVLVGSPEEIAVVASEQQISLEGIEIFDFTEPERLDEMIIEYHSRKGFLSQKALRRRAADPLNYAMMMLELGWVDAVFSGVVYTTNEVLMAAQGFIGLAEGIKTVCSLGIHHVPGFGGENGTIFGIGDCSTCVAPDSEMLADIAITSCDTFKKVFELEPRAAMLSFSTCGSGMDESVTKVQDAVAIAQEKRPDLAIDGEFQLDTAINPAVAARKVKRDSNVAGKANLLIFPEINAGNIGWKMMQEFGNSQVIGLILQGFAKPVGDCSRGDTPDTLASSIALLAAQA